MHKEFVARHLDVRRFAEAGATLSAQEPVHKHERLMAETQGRGGASAVAWSATGELRNAGHVHPEIWLHLHASTVLPLTCQRCLGPVDIALLIDRSYRFAPTEEMAAAQDDESEEDVLVLSRSFDLLDHLEDELLMEMPLAPRHEVCPEPVRMAVADEAFDEPSPRENPFAQLAKLRIPRNGAK